LLLVGGFLLVLIAIVVPGTGFAEVAAAVLLLLAGWTIYYLPINFWALVLIVLGVLAFLWALRRSGHYGYLGVSILALMVGSAFLFRSETFWPPAVHPLLAAVVSVLAGGSLWLVARKTLEAEKRPPAHDLERLIGAIGETETPVHEEGSVLVNAELWSARSEAPIPAGRPIRVLRREGFTLIVEELLEPQASEDAGLPS
jgi:membrane-bound serine protease (ClpP class)